MCLIALSLGLHPPFRLAVAANRDEFHDRPSVASAFWMDHPRLLAGRDLDAGGTWMGITIDGRFAAVTNFRETPAARGIASRGQLVLEFLLGSESPEAFVSAAARKGSDYGGFGLFVSDLHTLAFVSNRDANPRILDAGVHGLSNGPIDARWPKVVRSRAAIGEVLSSPQDAPAAAERLLAMLQDRTGAPDEELPDTGFGLDRERVLAPIFVADPVHGTRASTVLLVEESGAAVWTERRFDREGRVLETSVFRFDIAIQRG